MQDAMKPKPKDMPKPKPKSPGFDEPKIKKDYKVVENKIKKPEDKKKENKITKKASRSKTPIRMKNKKAK